MVKDKEIPDEVDELSGWRKLHRDYLAKKELEEKKKKETEEKQRRENLKTVPKRERKEEKQAEILADEVEEEVISPLQDIPFMGEKTEKIKKRKQPFL
ncbi:hypothetical protein STRDD10_01376 [Streptococcus sp. DD10]|uniref:hypothetical protein n=1 Tax=Streptococcus sp. DD10 TaxID=1777878 RepID=UPI000792BB25|nr:hypothetical protein [Streptococcus sp. DD10]KXT73753.1 hypothetical protein STRDD10_01376 [Streptococcus sp. DD10]